MQPLMYSVLDKDMIEMEIVPIIPRTKRGFQPTAPLVEIVNAVPYKLKTGVQWHQLPVRALFSVTVPGWRSVYHHYRKWCPSGTWKECWIKFLHRNRAEPELSSVDLDGSHTPALRGGSEVEYQGRKKRRATKALYLNDSQGLPFAMPEPVAGNHNDLYEIEVQFEVVTATLVMAEIPVEGPFLNADVGFGSGNLRSQCEAKEINANICFNKRNGNTDREENFDGEPPLRNVSRLWAICNFGQC